MEKLELRVCSHLKNPNFLDHKIILVSLCLHSFHNYTPECGIINSDSLFTDAPHVFCFGRVTLSDATCHPTPKCARHWRGHICGRGNAHAALLGVILSKVILGPLYHHSHKSSVQLSFLL